ncbi:MAG: FAD-dependent monooxygenase [Pseudomonadota bacterium]|nr:FAD-dependent monooxygenase [Pseudomonadota bacterium]
MSLLDVAIVGAGPVGATLASLIARDGLKVALFEARPGPASDRRTLALSHSSRELLMDAGAWPDEPSTPILSIHVSQQAGPGRTLIEAREHGIAALGYTVPYGALEAALARRVEALGVALNYGESCEAIALEPPQAGVRFASGRAVRARLLVLADGGANAGKIPGIAFHEKDYGQQAVVATVRTDKPHGGRAYERFTTSGPMALLPVGDRYALVWTATPLEAQRLLALEAAAFLDELQARFGDRAGRFTAVEGRASFPLKLRAVNTPIARRTAMIGNAAQALHPIAGQGLNLGLRDAAELAASISTTPLDELGGTAMLAAYRDARSRDAFRGVAFTDLLVSLFGDARRMPTWGRGLALAALDLFPPARRLLAERMIHGAPAP